MQPLGTGPLSTDRISSLGSDLKASASNQHNHWCQITRAVAYREWTCPKSSRPLKPRITDLSPISQYRDRSAIRLPGSEGLEEQVSRDRKEIGPLGTGQVSHDMEARITGLVQMR
jgi:hypothetical protein